MANIPQSFSQLGRHTLEDALGYAQVMVNGVERLFDIQCEATKTILEQQARNARLLFETKDPGTLMRDPARLFNTGMEQAIDSMRRSGQVMMEMQAELQQLAKKRIDEFNEGVQSGFEAVTTATASTLAASKEATSARHARRAA